MAWRGGTEQQAVVKREGLFTRPGRAGLQAARSLLAGRLVFSWVHRRLSWESLGLAGRAMAWLQSLLSPLKKLWVRMHSAQHKSTCASRLPCSCVPLCPCSEF